MTTKILIKLLQKEDPDGNLHVRINGECPHFVERKEGYWDGPYSYIENDDYHHGKYVETTIHDKVDINTVSLEDYIHDHNGDINMIQFQLNSFTNEINKAKSDAFWRKVKTIIAEYERQNQSMMEEFTFRVMKKLKDGWHIYQDKGRDIGQYNAMFYKRGKDTMRLCQGECGAILESGFFEHFIFTKDNIEWKLISEIC